MQSQPKSLGRVDSQRVKEIRFASATIVLGSAIIILNIVSIFLTWTSIEFGAAPPAAVAAAASANASLSTMKNALDPWSLNSSKVDMQLEIGIVGSVSGSIVSHKGVHSFGANFRTMEQTAGSVTLDTRFLTMCKETIPSSDPLHTNTFAVWMHYAVCDVTFAMLLLVVLSMCLTFISVLMWTLASWPIPFLDKSIPMWRQNLGLVLGTAVSLHKCTFASFAALGLSVAVDVFYFMFISSLYSTFLIPYAQSQDLATDETWHHESSMGLGVFVALIATALLVLLVIGQAMMVRELGMRDGFAGGSAVRYMDTRPQLPGHTQVHCRCSPLL